MNKAISLAILAGDVLLTIFGASALNSVRSDISRFFTGAPTDQAIWILVTAAVLGVLSGCASLPEQGSVIKVQWTKLETQQELSDACASDRLVGVRGRFKFPRNTMDNRVKGCYRQRADGICVLYTLKNKAPFQATRSEIARLDDDLYKTAGHELDHCYRGDYHVEDGFEVKK